MLVKGVAEMEGVAEGSNMWQSKVTIYEGMKTNRKISPYPMTVTWDLKMKSSRSNNKTTSRNREQATVCVKQHEAGQ